MSNTAKTITFEDTHHEQFDLFDLIFSLKNNTNYPSFFSIFAIIALYHFYLLLRDVFDIDSACQILCAVLVHEISHKQ
jgi:hypothetical protein